MTYPAVMVGFGIESALLQVRASLMLLVVVNIGARSLEMMGRDLLEESPPPPPPPPCRWGRHLRIGARDTLVRRCLAWWRTEGGEGWPDAVECA